MRIGYLSNMYPMTSTTFIPREIRALEALGAHVSRYAIREWDGPLVEKSDQVERDQTRYILNAGAKRLVADAAKELAANPRGVAGALVLWWKMRRNSHQGLVKNLAYFLEAIALKNMSVADEIDHLHAHWSTNTAAIAAMSRRLGGPAFSFTTHGPDELYNWDETSLALKLQDAAFGVAISHFCKTQLALAAGDGIWPKLHVVRCGVDLEQFQPSDAPFDDNAPFVCVGRLCQAKAQVLIVDAIAEVAKRHPTVKVVFLGDGDTRSEIETRIATYGLEQNVQLLGWADTDTVRTELGRARALLLPSFAEGLPVVIMEAFALGRPVISSYVAGIPELVTPECGWLVPPGSVEHIAKAMEDALETDAGKLAEMGRIGRARVEKMHNAQSNAAGLLDLFKAHASEKERGR